MIGLLGKKVGMTRVFEDGKAIAVTVVEVGPCVVTAVRANDKDGYEAVQLGYEDIVERKVAKPQLGTFAKVGVTPKKYLREFRVEGSDKFAVGQSLNVELFTKGEKVTIASTSKGRGFAGVFKRHNFRGGPATHGSNFKRIPGSNGMNTFPQRVMKGKGHPGHMGDVRCTTKNIRVIGVDTERNLLLLAGAVSGARGALVEIKKQGN